MISLLYVHNLFPDQRLHQNEHLNNHIDLDDLLPNLDINPSQIINTLWRDHDTAVCRSPRSATEIRDKGWYEAPFHGEARGLGILRSCHGVQNPIPRGILMVMSK